MAHMYLYVCVCLPSHARTPVTPSRSLQPWHASPARALLAGSSWASAAVPRPEAASIHPSIHPSQRNGGAPKGRGIPQLFAAGLRSLLLLSAVSRTAPEANGRRSLRCAAHKAELPPSALIPRGVGLIGTDPFRSLCR